MAQETQKLSVKDVTVKVNHIFKGKDVITGDKISVTEHQEKRMRKDGLIV